MFYHIVPTLTSLTIFIRHLLISLQFFVDLSPLLELAVLASPHSLLKPLLRPHHLFIQLGIVEVFQVLFILIVLIDRHKLTLMELEFVAQIGNHLLVCNFEGAHVRVHVAAVLLKAALDHLLLEEVLLHLAVLEGISVHEGLVMLHVVVKVVLNSAPKTIFDPFVHLLCLLMQ